jgi:hypothetical protein
MKMTSVTDPHVTVRRRINERDRRNGERDVEETLQAR